MELLDQIIAQKTEQLNLGERNTKFILDRLSYQSSEKPTIQSLVTKYKITSQRVHGLFNVLHDRIENVEKSVFEEFVGSIKELGLILTKEQILASFLAHQLWREENREFFFQLCERFFRGGETLKIDRDFVITDPEKVSEAMINSVISLVVGAVEPLKTALPITELKEELKSDFERDSMPDDLLTEEALSYIALISNKFFVKEGKVYNPIIYQITHGIRMNEVIFAVLQYFDEPKHVTAITKFIQANNNAFQKIKASSVHMNLMRNTELFKRTGNNTYTEINKNFERQVYAIEAVMELIKQNGPMTSKQIYKALEGKYTPVNIRFAFANNRWMFKEKKETVYYVSKKYKGKIGKTSL